MMIELPKELGIYFDEQDTASRQVGESASQPTALRSRFNFAVCAGNLIEDGKFPMRTFVVSRPWRKLPRQERGTHFRGTSYVGKYRASAKS